MNEEELIQHCEKQIMLCEALGDYKHCSEHQLILNIIQQRDLYKSVIKEIREYIKEHLTDKGRFLMLNEWQVPDLLQILDKGENDGTNNNNR